ncbi:MAG: 3-hydroxyacyl-ACP dehydratase FabZ [Spirochaetes bacterium]|nr:3-hydroxyacyl-ACP dehydratase FabZ [Spirochaetota bacterium]
MDIVAIKKLLPHRYPFLLIDRVQETGEKHLIALKNVTINEPFFQGHFPLEPIMPGVLQLEAMAQAAGIWAMQKLGLGSDSSVYFLTIDAVKFRKPVVPGDQLVIRVDIDRSSGSRLSFSATCSVEGQLVSEAKMMAMVKK